MFNDVYKKVLQNKMISDDIYKVDDPQAGFISTGVIILNLALSGKIDAAVPIGKITVNSAHSMLGKSIIGMSLIKDAQKKDIFCVVLDAEYAWDFDLAKNIGIDCSEDKLLVIQNNQIEDVQAKIVSISEGLTKEESLKIFYMFDSWGALVTHEAVKKSTDPDSKKDMGIDAVKKNKLANMMMNSRSTFYVANGVYDNIGGFGDPLKIPGGKRLIFNAQNVILGRSRSKEEITVKNEDIPTGSIVSCKVFKSRYSREHKEFKFRIKYEGGIDIFYGILPGSIEGGFVVKSEKGYYTRKHIADDKNWKERNLYCSEFWIPLFKETKLKEYLESQWSFSGKFDVANSNFYDDIKVEVKKEEVKSVEENKIV
jgi:RecA/RadA recombinase